MDERRTNVGYLGCLSQVAGMLLPLLACLVAAAVHDSGHPTAAIVWATLLILSGLALFFYGSGKVREATLLAKSREVAENAADPPADPDQQGTEAEPIGLEQDPLDVAARAVPPVLLPEAARIWLLRLRPVLVLGPIVAFLAYAAFPWGRAQYGRLLPPGKQTQFQMRRLNDRYWILRERAAEALGRSLHSGVEAEPKDAVVASLLRAAKNDPHSQVRRTAVQWVQQIPDATDQMKNRVVETLSVIVKHDPDMQTRHQAAEAVEWLTGRRVYVRSVAELVHILEHGGLLAQGDAAEALVRRGSEGIEALADALRKASGVIRAPDKIGTQLAVEGAIRKVGANDASAALAIARALGRKCGKPPLHYAADMTNIEVMQSLIDEGAGIDATTRDGETALCAVVKRMVTARDRKGRAFSRAKAAAESLIAKGADINVRDRRGRTLLAVAESRDRQDIADFLIAHGATATDGNAMRSGTDERR